MKIKDLPKLDMPREKIEKYGEQKLADHELLAIILGSGIKGMNALELSKKILKNMKDDKNPDMETLLGIKGLGRAKAAKILAAVALGKRLADDTKPEVLSPEDIWKLCADFRDSKREHFVAFYMDTRGRLLERQVISIGTLDAALAHPREVFEPAITLRASHVILAHNHPSGSLLPSEEDIELTKNLQYSGKIIGISLKDHIIVTKTSHGSILKHIRHG